MDARFLSGEPLTVPYIPGSDVAAGAVVVIGDAAFIADTAIKANATGVLSIGGGVYTVVSGEAIAAGKKVYWNDSTNKVVETATTGKCLGVLCPGESASGADEEILIFHFPDFSGSTPAAVVAAFTDNSGGTVADGTIAVITAPTALTDNGAGTADGTVAAMADIAIATSGGNTYADSAVNTAVNAVLAHIRNNFKEITTTQVANRAAIVALTDAITELATKQNAVLTALKNAGLMATA